MPLVSGAKVTFLSNTPSPLMSLMAVSRLLQESVDTQVSYSPNLQFASPVKVNEMQIAQSSVSMSCCA